MHEDVEFWDLPDQDQLRYTDLDEAVEYILDDIPIGQLPETIEVVGYARVAVNPPGVVYDRVLGTLLESLDEEYGDPEGDGFRATKEMEMLTDQYVDTIASLLQAWKCKPVTQVTVNVRQWIEKNAPSWLEELSYEQ